MIVRNKDQILGAALERLTRTTDVTVTSPGSVARTFFEIIAEELAYDYRIMDMNLSQMFVSSAGGDALDKLGSLFGVDRSITTSVIPSNEGRVYFYMNSSPTHVPGTSDIDNSVAAISIPAGTIVSTAEVGPGQNPVTWRVTEDAVIEVGSHMAYVSIEPVYSEINTIATGTLVYHDLGIEDVYVYNRSDLAANEYIESDSNYRYRIANAVSEAAKSNSIALRLAALSVNGVRDCKVIPLAHGVGTAKVVVVLEDPGSDDSTSMFAEAAAKVKEASSVGDMVTITRPLETQVDITAVVTGDSLSDQTKTIVRDSITRYLAGLSIGQPIVTSKIVAEALSVSPQIRDFVIIDGGFRLDGTPSVFSRTEAREDEQFFPGTITVL